MSKSISVTVALLLATVFGVVSGPAVAGGFVESAIATLNVKNLSFVDEVTGADNAVYAITRGQTGTCGALYKVKAASSSMTLLHMFSKSDPAGCTPATVSASSSEVGAFIIVATEEGRAFLFNPKGGSAITKVPGTAVGVSTQPASAHTPSYIYITTAGSNNKNVKNGAIYRATLSAAGKLSVAELIFAFPGGGGGAGPAAPAVVGADGDLYGTASADGSKGPALCQPAYDVDGCGIVYRLVPKVSGGTTIWHEEVLYTFQGGADGSLPASRLAIDGQGNVYGTTFQGGDLKSKSAQQCVGEAYGIAYGCGTVFKLTRSTTLPWHETVLYTFHDAQDGAQPLGPVVFDAKGNLYGTATAGGHISESACLAAALDDLTPGCGVIFELTPSTGTAAWSQSVLYRFTDEADGAQPSGSLTIDSAGNLFGTALAGGKITDACRTPSGFGWAAGCGVVFELKKPGRRNTAHTG